MGKGSCRDPKAAEFARALGPDVGPEETTRLAKGMQRGGVQKNFRQPLARTLEPGTLPEIFVDVDGMFRRENRFAERGYCAVSGPAQRIR